MFSKKSENGFALIEATIALLILMIFGVAAYYVLMHSNKNANSSNTSSSGTVKYINIPALSQYNQQNVFDSQLAQGNYLYAVQNHNELCGGCVDPFVGAGYIIYDGKKVFTGNLDSSSLLLCDNGQHYAYSDGSGNLFVDNRSVKSGSYGGILALSDTGIFATETETELDVGGKQIYSVGNNPNEIISGPAFSSDLTSYITGIDTNTELSDGTLSYAVYNGKTLSNNLESGSYDNNISENGEHYIYTSKGEVVVDGKAVYSNSNQQPSNLVVTDNGSYTFLVCDDNSSQGTIYINSASYSSGECNSNDTSGTSNTDTFTSAVFSKDSVHYFYFYTNTQNDQAVLDGKKITLSGQIAGADFRGDTLYVYRYVN